MKNKIVIILKVVSILAISFVHLPSQKLSIPYAMSIVFVFSERVADVDFASDFFLSLLFLIGIVFLFLKSRWVNIVGFILIVLPLLFFVIGTPLKRFNTFFWLPFFIYLVSAFIIIYKSFGESNKKLIK